MNDDLQMPGLPAGPTVTTAWLAAHAGDPRLVILDTRGRVPAPGAAPADLTAAHAAGHVPGARFVRWNLDFVDVDDPVPNQLAGPERFEAAAHRLGIGRDTVVVAYDDYHSIFAGRLWWAFRAMGHDAVRVLDGGLGGWIAGGHALEVGAAPPAHTAGETPVGVASPAFAARPRPELRWTIEQVAARDAATVLVDARSRERFAGTGSDPVSGHVPGAVNAPYAELVGADGFLRPADELRAVLSGAGIDPAAPPERLVASCGSGISASVPLLALETLRPGTGVRGAIYDGSWAEWSRSGRPIATGGS